MSTPSGYGRRRCRQSILVRWSLTRFRWVVVAVERTATGVERRMRARALDEFGGAPWRIVHTRGYACDAVAEVGQLLPPGFAPRIWGTLCPELLEVFGRRM